MDCLACFDLKAIFELFLSIFGKNTKKYKNIRNFIKKQKKNFFFWKIPPPNPFLKFWNFPRFDFYSTIGALWAFLKKNGNITFSLKMICSPLHIVLTIPHHLNCPHTPLNPLFQCLIEYILKMTIFQKGVRGGGIFQKKKIFLFFFMKFLIFLYSSVFFPKNA